MGILAHVDAGKTTLSEGLLYNSGMIRRMGRVDKKDSFLDTHNLEKDRGITVFSKHAVITKDDIRLILLDTPGHTDFSTEMERSILALDYALLIVSGSDGVEPHTETEWKLLKDYGIPVIVFVNKMDIAEKGKEEILSSLNVLDKQGFVDFSLPKEEFYEEIALYSERAMNFYLENGYISNEIIQDMIVDRLIYPVYFGSALKDIGVDKLLAGIFAYTRNQDYPSDFGALVYKISRDEQGNRLTFVKITGGEIGVKEVLCHDEKINQIRLYSGKKYELLNRAEAGDLVAITGPSLTYQGEGIGYEKDFKNPVLEAVLSYGIILPKTESSETFLPKIRRLEEENPSLNVRYDEKTKRINIKVMGSIELEILKELCKERFDVDIDFDEGDILYKETLTEKSYGIGHFEPLRHYAEVHLRLTPLPFGSGIVIDSEIDSEALDKNWQNNILSVLKSNEFRGVLCDYPITDLQITLVNGRAHLKHTEGNDMREATERALRNALRKSLSRNEVIILEPYYEFSLTVPENSLGKAMNDLGIMKAVFKLDSEKQNTVVGIAPVSKLRNYQLDLASYTGGKGRLSTMFAGYYRCKEQDKVTKETAYDCDSDFERPTGSIFCAHGAGFAVSWDEVYSYKHLEEIGEAKNKVSTWNDEGDFDTEGFVRKEREEDFIGTDEIDDILNRASGGNKKADPLRKRRVYREKLYSDTTYKSREARKSGNYLIVDGYNIIHSFDDLKIFAKDNMDGARDSLLRMLSDYQGFRGMDLTVVFDAYRVNNPSDRREEYHNVHVVFTKINETADAFIARYTRENGKNQNITVATNDNLVQQLARGAGCMVYSANDLKRDIDAAREEVRNIIS